MNRNYEYLLFQMGGLHSKQLNITNSTINCTKENTSDEEKLYSIMEEYKSREDQIKLMDKNIEKTSELTRSICFTEACREGDFKEAKRLVDNGLIDINNESNVGFRNACFSQNLQLAQWIHSFGKVTDYSSFHINLSCEYNNLPFFKWLWSLRKYYIGCEWSLFRKAAYCGYSDNNIVQFLLSQKKFSNDLVNDNPNTYNRLTCKLLYKLGYTATHQYLIKQFNEIIKDRSKYLKKVMKAVILFLKLYNIVLKKNYGPQGSGFNETRDHFNTIVKDLRVDSTI